MDGYVEVHGLRKTYRSPGVFGRSTRRLTAVDDVSVTIRKNTVLGLVGESGCGKSTLARTLLYLERPDAGEVYIGGIRLGSLSRSELRRFRRRMQIVLQDPNGALDPKRRIGKSIEEALINLGLPRRLRGDRIVELLELVGLKADHASRYPHEFSGGQKQRIVVARALALNPEFLVLDEPVSNLDVSIQAQIINLLLELKRTLALTYLFISHDLNLIAYLSDTIAVMRAGSIVEYADAEAIIANPRADYTRLLFAASPRIQTGMVHAPENIYRREK